MRSPVTSAARNCAPLTRDEHAHAEHVRGELADHCVRRGRSAHDQPLQRRGVGRHNRADGEELRLEYRARVCGARHLRVGDRVHLGERRGGVGVEEERVLDSRGRGK